MKKLLALLVLFALAPAAQADIVIWRATGHVINQLPYELGNGAAGPPGLVQVNFHFDTAAVDRDTAPTRGSYGNLVSVDVLINGQPILALIGATSASPSFLTDDQSALIIEDDAFSGGVFTDSFTINAIDQRTWGNEMPWGDMAYNSVSLRLAHTDASPSQLLTSDAIPGALPDLGNFEASEFRLSGIYSSSNLYEFIVELDSLQPVPIPAAAWLLVSGIGLLGGVRRAASRR